MRCLILLACLVSGLAVVASAQDVDAKQLPAVKRASDKAEATILRNRKDYDDSNKKALDEAKKELLKEAERLGEAKRFEEAAAVERLANDFRSQTIASAENKARPPNPAQKGAQEWNGHKYTYFAAPLPWDEAKKLCEEMGGHLLIIDDEKEQAFVLQGMTALPDAPRQIAIGAYLNKATGKWQTVLDKELPFAKWKPGEPSGDEPCVLMWVNSNTHSGFWVDAMPAFAAPYVCEWDE